MISVIFKSRASLAIEECLNEDGSKRLDDMCRSGERRPTVVEGACMDDTQN